MNRAERRALKFRPFSHYREFYQQGDFDNGIAFDVYSQENFEFERTYDRFIFMGISGAARTPSQHDAAWAFAH